MLITPNFHAEVAVVRDALLATIGKLARGVHSTVNQFATDIAADIVRARATGDTAKVDELTAQAVALAAVNKIKLAKGTNEVIGAFIRGALAVMSSALGGIPGAVVGVVDSIGGGS